MFHVLYAIVSMNDIQTYYYRISIVLLHYSNISRFPPGSDIDVYKYKNIRDASNIFTDLFLRGEKSKYGKIGTKFFLEVYQLSFLHKHFPCTINNTIYTFLVKKSLNLNAFFIF